MAKRSNKELLGNMRWAFKYTWRTAPRLFSGVIATSAIQSLLPATLALASRGLINEVVSSINRGVANTSSLYFWLGMSLILTAMGIISKAASDYFSKRLQDELNLHLMMDILTHAATLDYAYFEDPRFQDILFRSRQNPAQSFGQFVSASLRIITQIVQSISLIVLLVAIDPIVAVLLVPIVIPYMVFHWRLAQRRFGERYSRATKRRWTDYYMELVTAEQFVAETKLLNLAPLLIRRFREQMVEFRARDSKIYLADFWGRLVFALISISALYFAIARVVIQTINGGLTVGDVTVYLAATGRLRTTIEAVISGASNLREKSLDMSNLEALFELKPLKVDTGSLIPVTSKGEIAFAHVDFTYPGRVERVLSDISLHIRPGETVALVGKNGAGKTTLVKLIARLYDPDKGTISLDNVKLPDLSMDYLRRQISFVFQNFGRYEGTLAENIAFGNWRKLLNQTEQIEQLGQMAGLQDMVDAMPQGYDTHLGRRFGNFTLSAGQWQKIAISRAFARDSTLLILDEPTASLDASAEYDLFSRFKILANGRTTILISHRFSTVSMADRILVMDKGRIIEQGTHDKLMSMGGQYAVLFTLHQRQMNLSANGIDEE